MPRLANGPGAGYPRVYGIALELISHVDGRVDADSLSSFVAAYQTIMPLKLGELWAIPIMLRLALIENLRRVAARMAAGRRDRDLADDWAERMVEMVEKNPTDLILVLADMARANPPLTSAFVAELTRQLQGQSPYFAFAVSWLEHRASEQGLTIEQLVQSESQAQAADQVSIGNSITSLRFLGCDGLAQVRRGDEHRRTDALARSGRRLCRHGFRHPRPLPPRGRGDRQAQPLSGVDDRPHSRRSWPRRRRQDQSARSHGPRRLLPGRPRPADAGSAWRCGRRSA